MHFSRLTLIAGLLAVAHAHFQLQYPSPRGPFVEDNEPTFCDGYDNAVSNRTLFPLDNGIISLNSEHPQWSAEVMISTAANPNSFSDFPTDKLAVQPFKATGEGSFCFPINLTASGVDGVKDGANVTIQMLFNGGDGNLYQCADLTLSSTAKISNVSCTNATGTSSSAAATSSSTSPASPTPTGGAVSNANMVNCLMAFTMGLAGVVLAKL